MKAILKKLAELVIYGACVAGISLASASAGMVEIRVKFTIKSFSYTLNIP